MAVQRAVKLLYKYALTKNENFNSNYVGANQIEIRSTRYIAADGYSSIFGNHQLAVRLNENCSEIIDSPELQDQIGQMITQNLQNTIGSPYYFSSAAGSSLGALAANMGLSRLQGESDADFRTRINAMLGPSRYQPLGFSMGAAVMDGYGS